MKYLSRGKPFQKGHRINNGRKFSEEHKRKLSESHKGKLSTSGSFKKGHKFSLKTKIKMSESLKKNPARYWLGKKRPLFSEKTRMKMRESRFEYIKKTYNFLYPVIGHNEKQIFNNLEQRLNLKIIRQFKVCGYFIDGYIPKLKLAIEIDERLKNKDKDIERQKIIEKELNCKFIRINDYN